MRKDWRKLLDRAEAQGWTWVQTRRGRRYYSPDGKTMVTVHNTPGDWRAYQNALALFRSGGLDSEPE